MPRLGVGMPLSSGSANVAVTLIDDELFLNDVSGEVTTPFTGSRTNKILQSQTLKTTWTLNNAAIPNDLYEAPDNSLTAQAITATSSGASNVYAQQVVATTAGETYTYSAHVKVGANGFVLLLFFDGTTSRTAYFNAATGVASNTSNILTTSFDKMDDGWVRVSITFQNTVTTSSSFVRIFPAAAAGSTGTGAAFQAGTELLYIWGAQLEEDSRPSAYIVTTNTAVSPTVTLNDTHDAWDFDVDGDGVKTNDITPQSDPEGEGVWEEATANLVLNHDYEELGSEMLSQPVDLVADFSVVAGGVIVDADTFTTGGGSLDGIQKPVLTIGEKYKLNIDGDTTSSGFTIGSGGSSGNEYGSGFGTHYFTALHASLWIRQNTAGTTNITSFSIKQVDPNDRWVLGTGWSISGGKAIFSGSNFANLEPNNSIIVVGNTYELTLTAEVTNGSFKVQNTGSSDLITESSSGTYSVIWTATSTLLTIARATVGSQNDFTIDNVIVKEYAITPLDV